MLLLLLLTPPCTTQAPRAAAACNGTTPARLLVESVTPQPRDGEQTTVVLRNIGGNVANITGYRLSASNSPTPPAAGTNASTDGPTLYIASERRCRENGTLAPGQALFLRPRSDLNPCGFPFSLAQR